MIDGLIDTWNKNSSHTFIQNSIKDTIKVKMQCAAGDLSMQQCIKEIVRKRFSFPPSFQLAFFAKMEKFYMWLLKTKRELPLQTFFAKSVKISLKNLEKVREEF